MTQPNLYLCILLVLFGILFHFVLKLSELESQGKIVTPWAYWREHPYTSLGVVMGAYLFLMVSHFMNELTYVTALLIGIACNSIGDKLRARAEAAIQ
jgi:hypothetical protein